MIKDLRDILLEYLLILEKHIETKMVSVPPKKWADGKKGDVIIVPGFQETWVALKTPANYINNLGYRVHVIKRIQPNIFSIKFSTNEVKKYILNNQLKNVVLLAHSKGCLVTRYLLIDKAVYPKIKYSINIAAPNKGTIFGYFAFHNLKELKPNSNLYKELKLKEKNNKKIFNIYPRLDNHIIPNKNLFLEGANNFRIGVVGHTRIIESQETLNIINNILSAIH